MLVLFQAVSCAGDKCQPSQEGNCQFPFVMNNITLHSCTWYRSYITGGYPWCATKGGAGDVFWPLIILSFVVAVHEPRPSCSNMALCKPDSGQPISSLQCRPSSGACAKAGVLSLCEETHHGQTLSWCVSIFNTSTGNMAVHNSCPQHCQQQARKSSASFSLGFICSSSATECSIFFLLSLLLVVVVIFLR